MSTSVSIAVTVLHKATVRITSIVVKGGTVSKLEPNGDDKRRRRMGRRSHFECTAKSVL